jgi:hypothetical protein
MEAGGKDKLGFNSAITLSLSMLIAQNEIDAFAKVGLFLKFVNAF